MKMKDEVVRLSISKCDVSVEGSKALIVSEALSKHFPLRVAESFL